MSQHVQDMLYFFKQFLRPLLFFSEEALDFGYDFHVSESHPTVAMSNSSLLPSKRHSTFVMCNSSLFLKTSSQLPPWHPLSSHLKKRHPTFAMFVSPLISKTGTQISLWLPLALPKQRA
jgi:hypothetical protein